MWNIQLTGSGNRPYAYDVIISLRPPFRNIGLCFNAVVSDVPAADHKCIQGNGSYSQHGSTMMSMHKIYGLPDADHWIAVKWNFCTLSNKQILAGNDCIPAIHKMEQISSEEGIGSLSENLMEALKSNPTVAKKIDEVRAQTRAEKKRLAMAMRMKQLGALGMSVRPAD